MSSAKAEMLAASTGSGVTLKAVLATKSDVPETCTVSRATAIEPETVFESELTTTLWVAVGLDETTTTTESLTVALKEFGALGELELGATNAYAHSLPLSPKPLQLEQRSMPGVSFAAASATALAFDLKSSTLDLRSTSMLGS